MTVFFSLQLDEKKKYIIQVQLSVKNKKEKEIYLRNLNRSNPWINNLLCIFCNVTNQFLKPFALPAKAKFL